MKTKQILSILLALALTFTLAACGGADPLGGGTSTPGNPDSVTSQDDTPLNNGDTYTLPDTTASDVDTSFESVVDAMGSKADAKIAELTKNGTVEVELSEVADALYSLAQELASNGSIKNVKRDSGAVFFEYSDGTPGGFIMKIPEDETLNDAQAVQTSSLMTFDKLAAPTAMAQTAVANPDVIGNNRVSMDIHVKNQLDLTLDMYYSITSSFDAVSGKTGLEYVNQSMTVDDLKNLDQYGAVFLNYSSYVTDSSESIICLYERYTYSEPYYADRMAKRIGLFHDVVPSSQSYKYNGKECVISSAKYNPITCNYGVYAEKFFDYYYGNKQKKLPNSYIHLGYSNSMKNSKTADILMGAGARCITGHNNVVTSLNNMKAIESILTTMLGDTKKTTGDSLVTLNHKGIHSTESKVAYFKDTNCNTAVKTETNNFQICGSFDLMLWDDQPVTPTPSPLPSASVAYGPLGAPPEIINIDIQEEKIGGLTSLSQDYNVTITFSIRNNTTLPLTDITLGMFMKGINHGTASCNNSRFPIAPGRVGTCTVTFYYEKDVNPNAISDRVYYLYQFVLDDKSLYYHPDNPTYDKSPQYHFPKY